jgi:hypothetical protein
VAATPTSNPSPSPTSDAASDPVLAFVQKNSTVAISLTLLIAASVKLLAVSNGNPNTALAIIKTTSTGDLLTGTFISLLPAFIAVLTALATWWWAEYIEGRPSEKDKFGLDPPLLLLVLLGIVSFFILPLFEYIPYSLAGGVLYGFLAGKAGFPRSETKKLPSEPVAWAMWVFSLVLALLFAGLFALMIWNLCGSTLSGRETIFVSAGAGIILAGPVRRWLRSWLPSRSWIRGARGKRTTFWVKAATAIGASAALVLVLASRCGSTVSLWQTAIVISVAATIPLAWLVGRRLSSGTSFRGTKANEVAETVKGAAAVAAGVVTVVVLVLPTGWLPLERVTLRPTVHVDRFSKVHTEPVDNALAAFILASDDKSVTLLAQDGRVVLQLNAGDIESHQLCVSSVGTLTPVLLLRPSQIVTHPGIVSQYRECPKILPGPEKQPGDVILTTP